MAKVCEKHGIEYTKISGCMRCRECRREVLKEYTHKHAKEIKVWRTSKARKACRLRYDRSAKRKASNDRNRIHMRAREAVRRAVNRGILIPLEVCVKCGQQIKTEAHHHNGYEKSCQLDVVWLCHSCHMSIHTQ